MKQLLLRVDDELHARLAHQAATRGMSVNAMANSILDASIGDRELSRKDRLNLRLMAIGEIGAARTRRPELVAPDDSALESLRGSGPIADELMRAERGDR